VQARRVAQHTYEDVPASLAPLLREVGERRLALERERGGVRLAVPAQQVVQDGDGWTVRCAASRRMRADPLTRTVTFSR
jgi:hypothetical protein